MNPVGMGGEVLARDQEVLQDQEAGTVHLFPQDDSPLLHLLHLVERATALLSTSPYLNLIPNRRRHRQCHYQVPPDTGTGKRAVDRGLEESKKEQGTLSS